MHYDITLESSAMKFLFYLRITRLVRLQQSLLVVCGSLLLWMWNDLDCFISHQNSPLFQPEIQNLEYEIIHKFPGKLQVWHRFSSLLRKRNLNSSKVITSWLAVSLSFTAYLIIPSELGFLLSPTSTALCYPRHSQVVVEGISVVDLTGC